MDALDVLDKLLRDLKDLQDRLVACANQREAARLRGEITGVKRAIGYLMEE